MAQYPTVTYPSGRSIVYNLGTGMHDLTGVLNGNGFTASTVTAHAGGGRAAATPLTGAINLVAVCATAGDSVMLPPATGGQLLWVSNAGVASTQIFANTAGSDTINGVAAGTGVALAAGKSDVLMSPLSGAWFTVASA
jgi:hypothetical protein